MLNKSLLQPLHNQLCWISHCLILESQSFITELSHISDVFFFPENCFQNPRQKNCLCCEKWMQEKYFILGRHFKQWKRKREERHSKTIFFYLHLISHGMIFQTNDWGHNCNCSKLLSKLVCEFIQKYIRFSLTVLSFETSQQVSHEKHGTRAGCQFICLGWGTRKQKSTANIYSA